MLFTNKKISNYEMNIYIYFFYKNKQYFNKLITYIYLLYSFSLLSIKNGFRKYENI